MTDADRPLLHICYAPADRGWVHGRMVRELGVEDRQVRTREDDGLGELQLQAIAEAVEACQFTVLIASSAARWDKLAQFAAGLAQHAGLEGDVPRLIIVARDFTPASEEERARLSLGQRALVGLDCSDEERTTAALARLRTLLALDEPVDERPACPYPGLARFTEANRDLLFGRDGDRDAVLQRIRGRHTRILVVGPSGSAPTPDAVVAAVVVSVELLHPVPAVPPSAAPSAVIHATNTTDALHANVSSTRLVAGCGPSDR
jgi:hypothetical protein